jgi:D-tyrosyl-tRNA(Tyr) deacylase
LRIVIQRVSRAGVSIGGVTTGNIGPGLCALVGIASDDGEEDASWAAAKTVNLRIFEDDRGKMNRSLLETGGEALVISQFTLYSDCRKGRRPSFAEAAEPNTANRLYESFVAHMRKSGAVVRTGTFGADMSVEITNEGPVTIILDTACIRKTDSGGCENQR